jgi:hypothetical protein
MERNTVKSHAHPKELLHLFTRSLKRQALLLFGRNSFQHFLQ